MFSIAEALIADMNPRSFSDGYDSLRLINPAPIGTTLTVTREVIEPEEYNDSLGRIVCKYEVEDQEGTMLLGVRAYHTR